MRRWLAFLAMAVWVALVWAGLDWGAKASAPVLQSAGASAAKVLDWNTFFGRSVLSALPIADRFDFPLRPPDGAGAYIGHPFGDGGHAGEDWNTAVGDGDLGEPVHSPADGWVTLAMDFQSAWGKVILVDYRLPPGQTPPVVEMMFAHLSEMDVKAGDFVTRGQVIGKVGNDDGVYSAHLHWEVRNVLDLKLGGAYADDLAPWSPPSAFIAAHRGADGGTSKAKSLPKDDWARWGGD